MSSGKMDQFAFGWLEAHISGRSPFFRDLVCFFERLDACLLASAKGEDICIVRETNGNLGLTASEIFVEAGNKEDEKNR